MALPTLPLRRLSRFALVGVAATAVYAACTLLFLDNGVAARQPAEASFLAYLVAGVFSYAGHKYFTFVSGGAHRVQLPRFLLLNAVGLVIAVLLPKLLSEQLHLPVVVPVLLTCVAVPAINYLILERWVFRDV